MNNKPRTRFCVTFDGQQMEIFSVLQSTDRSLMIFLRSGAYLDDRHTGDIVPLKFERISVHPSSASPKKGHTIKRHTGTTSGRLSTSVLFVKNSHEELFTPIFTKILPLLNDRYLLRARAKDKIIEMGKFDSEDLTNFVFTMVVTEPNRVLAEAAGHSLLAVQFECFQIAIYYTYVDFPAVPISNIAYITSRGELVEGEPKGLQLDSDGADSLDPSTLDAYLLEMNLDVTFYIFSKTQEITGAKILEGRPVWFYPSPDSLRRGRSTRGYV